MNILVSEYIYNKNNIIMSIPKTWTEEQLNLLKSTYGELSKEEVLKAFPQYKWRYLQNIATELKIPKMVDERRKGNMCKLLDGSLESFYWLGLIVTDGSIMEDGTLKVELSVEDYDYLTRLGDFLNVKVFKYPHYQSGKKNGKGTCRVKLKNIIEGAKLRQLLKIDGKKTYNPVSIEFIKTREEMISFLCGCIDGDGTIDIKGDVKLDAHKNYENYMVELGDRLIFFDIIKRYSITKYKDMVRINFGRDGIKELKKEILKLKLPYMDRKWSRIKDL